MTLPLLLLLSGPVIALAALWDYARRRRNPRKISAAEWLEGMRALDTVKPMASRIEGDPDWRDPRKRRRKRKPVEVNVTPIRKSGTK